MRNARPGKVRISFVTIFHDSLTFLQRPLLVRLLSFARLIDASYTSQALFLPRKTTMTMMAASFASAMTGMRSGQRSTSRTWSGIGPSPAMLGLSGKSRTAIVRRKIGFAHGKTRAQCARSAPETLSPVSTPSPIFSFSACVVTLFGNLCDFPPQLLVFDLSHLLLRSGVSRCRCLFSAYRAREPEMRSIVFFRLLGRA